jgi:hypothetical protein
VLAVRQQQVSLRQQIHQPRQPSNTFLAALLQTTNAVALHAATIVLLACRLILYMCCAALPPLVCLPSFCAGLGSGYCLRFHTVATGQVTCLP